MEHKVLLLANGEIHFLCIGNYHTECLGNGSHLPGTLPRLTSEPHAALLAAVRGVPGGLWAAVSLSQGKLGFGGA